ncbi:MAG: ATP-binding protein [Candidatus Methanomethyliaceae archaeon]
MQTPEFIAALVEKYRAAIAHVFLLYFNVSDYVVSRIPLKTYLAGLFRKKGLIVYYDRSGGIRFAAASMEERARKLLGLDREPDEALAALQAVTGNSAEKMPLPRQPREALAFLERLLRLKKLEDNTPVGVVVIIEYAESLVPDGDMAAMSPEDRDSIITIRRWARDGEIQSSGNLVILLAENLSEIHASLRAASSRIEAIKIPLPDYEERLAFIREMLTPDQEREPVRLEGMTPEEFARISAGLSKVHLEDIELRAADNNGVITPVFVRERKQEIIASEFAEVLEILEPSFGFEAIGGLEHVKRFFQEEIVVPIKEGRFAQVPMGVGLFGPPGTGKTAIMAAAAKESGFNAVLLNLSKILGPYVGNSERNLEKALSAIDALVPAFVFIDEADQAGIGRSQQGDSGVGNRLFKRLLEYMSDTRHRGRVVFFLASNRPDLLDAALKRPGRLDAKIPFLVPGDAEREEIFKAIARKYGYTLEVESWGEPVAKTKGWTGAEIEAVLNKAARHAWKTGRSVITDADIEYALWAIRPSTGEIEFQTLLAVRECNDKDLLPPNYQAELDDRSGLEKKIDDLAPSRRTRRDI